MFDPLISMLTIAREACQKCKVTKTTIIFREKQPQAPCRLKFQITQLFSEAEKGLGPRAERPGEGNVMGERWGQERLVGGVNRNGDIKMVE